MKNHAIIPTILVTLSLVALSTVGFAQRRISTKKATKGKMTKAQALKLNKKLNKGGTVTDSPSTAQIKKAHPEVVAPAQPEYKVSFGATKLIAKDLEVDESRLKKQTMPKLNGDKSILSSGASVFVASMHNIDKYNYAGDRRVNRYANSIGKVASIGMRIKNLSPNTSYYVVCKTKSNKTGTLTAIYKKPGVVSWGSGAFSATGKGTVAGILAPPHKERNASIVWSTNAFSARGLAPCKIVEVIMQ